MKTPDIACYFVEDDATFTIAATDLLGQYGDMRCSTRRFFLNLSKSTIEFF